MRYFQEYFRCAPLMSIFSKVVYRTSNKVFLLTLGKTKKIENSKVTPLYSYSVVEKPSRIGVNPQIPVRLKSTVD